MNISLKFLLYLNSIPFNTYKAVAKESTVKEQCVYTINFWFCCTLICIVISPSAIRVGCIEKGDN